MRLFKSIILFLLAGIVLIFAFQNFSNVQISFLNWNIEVPLAFAILIIYILGALSGGMLLNVLKKLTLEEKSETK
jgi:putative membrane protein